MSEDWLRTDEYGEVRDTLRACVDFSQNWLLTPRIGLQPRLIQTGCLDLLAKSTRINDYQDQDVY